jgi:predicted nucleotidyltransferase
MLKLDNRSNILKVFFDDPANEYGFQLRQISRLTNIAPKSVKLYLEELLAEDLIFSKNHPISKYPIYFANRDSDYFKILKKLNTIKNIHESGLIEFLRKKYFNTSIILFGSASSGEDILGSDIDLFIQADNQNAELFKYEKELNRKINVLYRKDFGKISKELKNNILNGIILKGYIKVF